MIFIIKNFVKSKFLLVLLLSSCQINLLDRGNYEEFLSLLNNFSEEEINDYMYFYENNPYSFLVLRYPKKEVLFVAASIEDGYLLWVGPNQELIRTLNGKIVSTYGLTRNIKTLSPSQFKFEKNRITSHLVKFDDEPSYVKSTITLLDEQACKFNHPNLISDKCIISEETIFIDNINWQRKNIYYLNDNKEVVKTLQYYHPLEEQIEITFYYKR